MSIDKIRLEDMLPAVFAGMEHESPVCDSQVWLHDLTLRRGEHYSIEAESGTGKSSLCSYIYGLRTDYSGRVLLNDNDARLLSMSAWSQIRRTQLALLPQEMRLFPELTARENVEMKNRLTGYLSSQRITEMFELLGIADKQNSPVSQMSIGQQQRVAIIRTLAQPFSFVILDEPVSHLDERNNRIVSALVLEQAHAQGASIISTSVGNPLLLDAPQTHLSL